MPLRKINKIIAHNTIGYFNLKDNAAINYIFNQFNLKKKMSIEDLGFLIGPIINSGGRLNYSKYGVELLSTDDHEIIKDRANKLINLNNKRKKIEQDILDQIDFNKIENENNNVIVYYKPNINEGLIGIIASRLKDYFNKPSIVITNSNEFLKGSARSIYNYNIGSAIKNAMDRNIIITGGGHNMAAGFTLKKENLSSFKDFLFQDFDYRGPATDNKFNYDGEISSIAFNKNFFADIKKIGPFGIGNPVPTFLFKDLKIIKTNIINNNHISSILKSKIGFSIKSISFNSVNNKIGEYLLNYKKDLGVLGQINENFWNNKNTLQLTIKDIII
jgi:single-stranded-DNA-specific exonuclease